MQLLKTVFAVCVGAIFLFTWQPNLLAQQIKFENQFGTFRADSSSLAKSLTSPIEKKPHHPGFNTDYWVNHNLTDLFFVEQNSLQSAKFFGEEVASASGTGMCVKKVSSTTVINVEQASYGSYNCHPTKGLSCEQWNQTKFKMGVDITGETILSPQVFQGVTIEVAIHIPDPLFDEDTGELLRDDDPDTISGFHHIYLNRFDVGVQRVPYATVRYRREGIEVSYGNGPSELHEEKVTIEIPAADFQEYIEDQNVVRHLRIGLEYWGPGAPPTGGSGQGGGSGGPGTGGNSGGINVLHFGCGNFFSAIQGTDTYESHYSSANWKIQIDQ